MSDARLRAAFLRKGAVRRRSASGTAAEPIPRIDPARPVPLSFAQQRLWFLHRLQPSASRAYHLDTGLRLTGPLDARTLRRALDRIVERHAILRTTFHDGADGPVQVVGDAAAGFALAEHDLSGHPAPERDRLADDLVREASDRPFDLENGPLIRGLLVRLAEADHLLTIHQHHIVSDGLSVRLLRDELARILAAFAEGGPDPMPPLAVRYADYAAWSRTASDPERDRILEDYWSRQLGDAPPLLELCWDRPRPRVKSYDGASVPVDLPGDLCDALRALGRRHGATLFMVLLAAWGALLHRLSAQPDVVIGSPVANRTRPEFEPLLGFFVDTVAFRLRLDDDPTIATLIAHTKSVALDAYAHQDLPFERVVRCAGPDRDLAYTPVFQAVLALNAAGPDRVLAGDIAMETVDLPRSVAQFDLSLSLNDDGSAIAGHVDYATDLFEPASVRRIADRLLRMLHAFAHDDGLRVSAVDLMSEDESRQVRRALNPDPRTFAEHRPIHRLFERAVAAHPHAIALSVGDEKITYAELDRRANRLAHRLVALGTTVEDRVAICADRGTGMIVAILAVLKAGGAYVPIDPGSPADRLEYLLRDSRPRVVLADPALAGRVPRTDAAVVTLGEEAPDAAAPSDPPAERPPDVDAAGANAAYVIYTSGSTGRPKGVVVEHRNVTRLFAATGEWFGFGPSDVWTLFHSFAFDFSVWEIWGALLHGGRLVVVPTDVARSPAEFRDLLDREGVTVLNQTPSAFRQLMPALVEPDGSADAQALRVVIFGGEALELEALRPWFASGRGRRTRLVNMYGITETTVHVTYREITAEDVAARLPSVIGRPIPDLRLHILDGHGRPVPPGVIGEIHVGGAGVARGYLDRPALTAERFVPDPEDPAGRLYRTGDLARLRLDGEVEYVGRNDSQVKIRGFRIELGEIEAKILSLPDIRDVAVIVRDHGSGDRRLVAYFVASRPMAATDLRQALGRDLAEYMIPSAFVRMDRLPLTINGKLDRSALPEAGAESAAARAFDAPRGERESAIAAVWADVLGIERVGRQDHFFELGGHSVMAVQVADGLSRTLGVRVAVRDLFATPVLAELARSIGSGRSALVTIRAGGARRPLVLVHPVEGEVGYARVLARYLDADLPVLALAADGLADDEEPPTSVDAMVSTYLAALRAVQPRGPYRLAGWSAGGVVAEAMAARLTAEGETVEFLGLIDTAADYRSLPPSALGIDDPGRVLDDPAAGLPDAVRAAARAFLDEAGDDATLSGRQLRQLAERPLDVSTILRHLRVRDAVLRAVRAYRRRAAGVTPTVFAATDERRADPSLGWTAAGGGEATIVPVPGTHFTLVEPPRAEALAAAIEAALPDARPVDVGAVAW